MPNEQYSEKSQELQRIVEGQARQISQRIGFVQRESKMTGEKFAQTMVIGCLGKSQPSLNDLVQVSADLGVDISASGLNQRIDWEAVELLRELLAESIQQLKGGDQRAIGVLQQFSKVYLLDSTHIGLADSLRDIFRGLGGDGPQASVKLYLSYEYLSGDISALEVSDGRSPDQKCRLHVEQAQAGSLHVFDLGFFKQEVFAELDETDAYFVSRYQSQTDLYWRQTDPDPFDVAAVTQSMAGNCCEIQAYLGRKSRVPVRVIFQRLPPKVVQERRRKAKAKMRHEKKTPSQRYLQLLEWAIFITNVPASCLTLEQVVLVYRIRWQIEVVFKVWKSEAHLDHLREWRPERVLCQLFARLIGLVLFHWLVAPYRFLPSAELSLAKAFHVLRRHLSAIAHALASKGERLAAIFARLEADLLRFARKDPRKKSPSTFQSLCLAGA